MSGASPGRLRVVAAALVGVVLVLACVVVGCARPSAGTPACASTAATG